MNEFHDSWVLGLANLAIMMGPVEDGRIQKTNDYILMDPRACNILTNRDAVKYEGVNKIYGGFLCGMLAYRDLYSIVNKCETPNEITQYINMLVNRFFTNKALQKCYGL